VQNGSRGGGGHGGDERDSGRNWWFNGHHCKRYSDEEKKNKAKRQLEQGALTWVSVRLLVPQVSHSWSRELLPG